MNTNARNDNSIDAILREAHKEIEPPDSWEALRTRIDRRIDGRESSSVQLGRSVAFWRRMALAMAACFLVASGLLIYIMVFVPMGHLPRQAVAQSQGLFSQTELDQSSRTFSNVRQLFGQQLPWIMVGSGNDAEIGVDQTPGGVDTSKVVIVRLAVNSESQNVAKQYFDIVTFSNQQVIPIAIIKCAEL